MKPLPSTLYNFNSLNIVYKLSYLETAAVYLYQRRKGAIDIHYYATDDIHSDIIVLYRCAVSQRPLLVKMLTYKELDVWAKAVEILM